MPQSPDAYSQFKPLIGRLRRAMPSLTGEEAARQRREALAAWPAEGREPLCNAVLLEGLRAVWARHGGEERAAGERRGETDRLVHAIDAWTPADPEAPGAAASDAAEEKPRGER